MSKRFGVRRLVGALPCPSPATGQQSCDKSQHSKLSRRAFFRTVLLAGTGGLAWVLLRRSCAGKGACGGCASYVGCGLPWKEARR